MKKPFLASILILFSIITYAQSNQEEILNKFFKEYAKNPSKAVDEIYLTNPWNSRIRDGIETMKQEVNKYTLDYVGKYYGYELITKKKLSESFILYSYMVKYDRQPMRFVFMLYKPLDKWALYSFTIDADIDEELDQAAKIYYLDLDNGD